MVAISWIPIELPGGVCERLLEVSSLSVTVRGNPADAVLTLLRHRGFAALQRII